MKYLATLGYLSLVMLILLASCKSPNQWGINADKPSRELLAQFRHLRATGVLRDNALIVMPDNNHVYWGYVVTPDGKETIRRQN